MIYSQGYGIADLEHDVPITSKSVFYMASVSKHFVTMCILLLEEEGKLDLDAEIQTYLPDFPRYDDPLTIRHFIHHTSGVRDNLTLWSLAGNTIYDHIDKDAIYELIKQQKSLNFTPGERYLYSNSCYFMLGLIVEKVSGLSIREYAKRNMFEPLGMKNTHFHDDVNYIVKNRAFSYSPNNDGGYNNLIMRYDLVGSGGLYSNVEDMLLWDQNFYHNKLGGGQQSLIDKMHVEGLLNSGESSNYAFGLVNSTYRGVKTVGHSGALAGYRTYYLRVPDHNFSVVILANVSSFNSGTMVRAVVDILLEDVLEEEDQESDTANGNNASSETTAVPDLSNMAPEDYAGKFYSEELGVTYTLFVENNQLQSRIRYQNPLALEARDRDVFAGGGRVFSFKRANGQVAGFSINAGRVTDIEFIKQ